MNLKKQASIVEACFFIALPGRELFSALLIQDMIFPLARFLDLSVSQSLSLPVSQSPSLSYPNSTTPYFPANSTPNTSAKTLLTL